MLGKQAVFSTLVGTQNSHADLAYTIITLMPMTSAKEKQGEETRMESEETEGSSLSGGQCVPEKKWAEEKDAWNPSLLETDRSRWLVSEAVSSADNSATEQSTASS